jgi:hypothetical protein
MVNTHLVLLQELYCTYILLVTNQSKFLYNKSGITITLSKALGASSYKLDDVVITTTANKQKETALLMDQKNAVEIKQSIGSQELARKELVMLQLLLLKRVVLQNKKAQEYLCKRFRRPIQLYNNEWSQFLQTILKRKT